MKRRTEIPRRSARVSYLFFLLAFVLVAPGFAQALPGQAGARIRGQGPHSQWGPGPRALGLPTVAEMATAIDADAAQRAALAEARLAFIETTENRGPHRGPRIAPGGGPMQAFLVKAGEALSVDQMSSLIDLLETRALAPPLRGRQRRHHGTAPRGAFGPGERRGSGGPRGFCDTGPRGHQGRGSQSLLEALDLNADQRSRAQVLLASTRAALRALASQVERGAEPSPELRARMQEIRDDAQAKLEEILGAEKYDRLQTLRDERRSDRAEESQARWKERRAERLAMLDAVLDLKPRQRTAIEEILDEAHQRATDARMQRWETGGPLAPLLTERGLDRDVVGQAIAERLEPVQREVFAKLRTLQRHAPRMHRQGPCDRGR